MFCLARQILGNFGFQSIVYSITGCLYSNASARLSTLLLYEYLNIFNDCKGTLVFFATIYSVNFILAESWLCNSVSKANIILKSKHVRQIGTVQILCSVPNTL